MKVIVTLTKEEKERTLERLRIDACRDLHCNKVHCSNCPFEKEVNAFINAKDALVAKIRAAKVEEE